MTRRTILLSAAAAVLYGRPTRWIAAGVTGRIRESNWAEPEAPVCFGSLLKPFLALAYLATHSQPPIVDCAGESEGCWYPQGHGRQDMVGALANSCNVYFRQIAETLNRAALDLTCMSHGLALPSRTWPATRLIGLGQGWPQTPLAVVEAFASLARDPADSHTRVVLAGMLRCCQSGTAKAIGVPCYAKTGTAAASERHDVGDGYVVAIYPVERPRTILLLGRRNTTGAEAAKNVKPLLARLA